MTKEDENVDIKKGDKKCECGNISGDVIFVDDYSCEIEGCEFGKYHWHCKDCGDILEDINIHLYDKYPTLAFAINIKRGTYDRNRFTTNMTEQDAKNYRTGYEIRLISRYCKDGRYYDYNEFFRILNQLVIGNRKRGWMGNKKEDVYQFILEIHSERIDERYILDKNYMEKYLKDRICHITNIWSSRDDDRRIKCPLHDTQHLERISCYLACLFIAEKYYLYNKNTRYDPGSFFLLDAIRQVVIEGKNEKKVADMYKKEKHLYIGSDSDYQKYIRQRLRIF